MLIVKYLDYFKLVMATIKHFKQLKKFSALSLYHTRISMMHFEVHIQNKLNSSPVLFHTFDVKLNKMKRFF